MLSVAKKIIKESLIRLFNVLLKNSKYESDLSDLKKSILEINKKIGEESKAVSDSVSVLVRNHKGAKIRVGFLVHNIEAWRGLEPVYRAMQEDDAFDPIVFSVNRRYAGDSFRDEDLISSILTDRRIPHIRFNDKDSFRDLRLLKLQALNAIFRQSHWLPDLPPAFQPCYLSFTNLYYLPYEIGVMPKQGLEFRYSEYETLCSKVFLSSLEIKKEMDGLPNAMNVKTVISGHPKVFELLRAVPSWPLHTQNKVKIIWSAHHSIGTGWSDFGVFDMVFEEFLKLAKKRKDWDILFSPHPALIHRLENLENSELKEKVNAFWNQWNRLENTSVISMGEYFGPFHSSSILIVDGLSFLIEYQLLNKPIIQLTRKGSSRYTEFGERVTKGVHKFPYTSFTDLEDKIENLLIKPDPLSPFQLKLREELTRVNDPSQRILNEIKKDLL